MEAREIKQEVSIKAAPHEVYECLMDSKKHSEVTGDTAIISREVGGSFSAFSGYATGKNLELVPDEKITQTWRASDWEEGHYSQITITLEEVDGATKLTFTQTGVPAEQYEDVSKGWYDYYWEPMKDYLEK